MVAGAAVALSVRRALIVFGGVLLAACAPPVQPPPAVGAAEPPGFPTAYYRRIESRGGQVLRVDPRRSLVSIEVGRAGALARLGHDHVVAIHDLAGYVAPAEGRADLYVPLERLSVDEPELRAAAGFETQPGHEAVAGTRRNMLGPVLDAANFPVALVGVTRLGDSRLEVSITLHGATRTYEVPAQLATEGDTIVARGRLSFAQSDFGIVPMSVFGGALQVRDRLDLAFRVTAAER